MKKREEDNAWQHGGSEKKNCEASSVSKGLDRHNRQLGEGDTYLKDFEDKR